MCIRDRFPGSGYIGKYVEGSYTDYEIPPEALDDEVFAAIISPLIGNGPSIRSILLPNRMVRLDI